MRVSGILVNERAFQKGIPFWNALRYIITIPYLEEMSNNKIT
jgi:hypothetical protein